MEKMGLKSISSRFLCYYFSPNSLEDQFQITTSMQNFEDEKETTEWEELNPFFRKYNRALLSKLAIDQEHAKLLKENQDLRSILKQYLDGISVTGLSFCLIYVNCRYCC